jgi:hypothetical protein
MLTWKRSDLPLEFSPKPFRIELFQRPILLDPCWVVLDRDGTAVALVTRASDATKITELLSRQSRRQKTRAALTRGRAKLQHAHER